MSNTDYRRSFTKEISFCCLMVSLILFLLSLSFNTSWSNTEKVAEKLGDRIEERLALLEDFGRKAMKEDHSQWLELKKLPPDMVIYRYVCDTLQSWSNQFPVINDDISTKMIFQRLTNLRSGLTSPLSHISERPKYISLGSKWFIVKSLSDSINCKVVCGLEIQDNVLNLQNSDNGVNPKLKLPGKYTVLPLTFSGGCEVDVDGGPLLKVIPETAKNIPVPTNALLRWISLILFVLASVLYLLVKRTIRAFSIISLILAVCMAIAYIWGIQMQNISEFFSPTVYADGPFLFSLGAIIIINSFVFLQLICIFIVRKTIITAIHRSSTIAGKIIYTSAITLLILGTIAYIHYSLVSIIMNSNISLELYQWYSLSKYSVLIYISYTCLFFCILLLIQMLRPPLFDMSQIRYNVFSKKFLFIFVVICAFYMSTTASTLGFRKEQNRISVMSNRLAVERDLSLEIQLRSVEDAIASDPLIASLSELDRSNIIILNRLTENYLYRISQDYNITVTLCKDNIDKFTKKIMSGYPIAGSSKFLYIRDVSGTSSYLGTFIYWSADTGIVHMFIEIEAKTNRGDNGFTSILGRSSRPDEVNIPFFYSYAKYISGKLVSYRGNYPYPTVIDNHIGKEIADGTKTFRAKKYIHFANQISDEELIVISRTSRSLMTHFVTFTYLIIIMYSLLIVLSSKRRPEKNTFRKNYYRSRINTVLFLALFLTLIIMTLVSITFVYKRNETNMFNMMSSKINTIQALMEESCRFAKEYHDLNSAEFTETMDRVANTTKSDITLYTSGGKVFKSTAPEIFDKMILGSRMDQEAYYNIKYKNQKFFIDRKEVSGHKFFSLYAPLFNAEGNMIAILNSPYTDQSHIFRRDAFFHGATIVNLFIILLFATILLSTMVVNTMFKPLIEMGKKMNATDDLHGLEYIIYKGDDEISTVVDAYNRMVHDLSESTKKLTQAERDKAWSEMARQVAHEIKNPLTPIKLEIQRLIIKKKQNAPDWETRFDKAAGVILEHIDILTETANEFSTFAKLYSEEPVRINLGETLKDQLAIFDNKDNITFSFIDQADAFVKAPKPQLIRVFVNLITNAIQAIEISQKEMTDAGKEPAQGHILICLRNSIRDGFYDIVFEDNGPGVSDDHRARLFTPNFTTKSSGTGLGLAICRNIIEKCNGEISYQKSFALKGACFTVRLPKD